MSGPDDLANWAAAFLRQYQLGDDPQVQPNDASTERSTGAEQKYPRVTIEASRLLESVDMGGVPAFVTRNLLGIARENGLDAHPGSSPNDIIAALRRVADAGSDEKR